MATTRRKVIGTATLTFGGSAVTLGVTNIPTGVSPEAEVDDAAAFGDTVKTHVARNLASLNTFDVELINEGAASGLAVGQTGTVVVALTFRNGVDADVSQATAISETATITKIDPDTVEVDGDRKAVIVVTFQPVGGADRTDVSFSAVAAATTNTQQGG